MKAYKSVSGFLLGACIVVLGACGGGKQLDEAEATGVMQAALRASTAASKQVETGLSGTSSGDFKVEGTADHFSVHGTVTSPDGGTATIDGEGTSAKAGAFSADFSLTFDHWKDQANNVVLDGELDMTVTTTVGEGNTAVEAQCSGELDVSGSVTGTINFDVSVTTKISPPSSVCISQSGNVGGVSIDTKTGC